MVGRRSIACPYRINSQKETSHARDTAPITTGSARRIYDLDANPKYKCLICDLRFYHKRSLEAHKLRHIDTLPRKCSHPEERTSKANIPSVKMQNKKESERPAKNVWMMRLANIKRRLMNTFKLWPTHSARKYLFFPTNLKSLPAL